MAARTRTAKGQAMRAGQMALAARSNPIVDHVVSDDQFRESVRTAFEAARDAYQRMSNGKGPARALMDDKKVQRDIKQAVESIRDAAEQLREKPRRRGRAGRKLLAIAACAALVLVLSEGARKALMDKLFGSEEEFQYTSTTTPE